MQRFTGRSIVRRLVLGMTGGVLLMASAAHGQVGVAKDTGIDKSGSYQQERAWCMANTAGEARVDCLRNSAAALAEKRRGTLDNKGANFEANAMLRCDVFTGEDRAACRARIAGHGQVSGSVLGGGVLRQVETVVPADGTATKQ